MAACGQSHCYWNLLKKQHCAFENESVSYTTADEKTLLSFLSSQDPGSGIQAMKAEMHLKIQGRFYLERYIAPKSIILPHSRFKV